MLFEMAEEYDEEIPDEDKDPNDMTMLERLQYDERMAKKAKAEKKLAEEEEKEEEEERQRVAAEAEAEAGAA